MANTLKKAFTNANWSKVADEYDRMAELFIGLWVSDALQLAHRRIFSAAQARLTASASEYETPQPPALTFVDVGCGTGALTLAFAEKYLSATPASASSATTDAAAAMQSIQIIATDLADGMLARVTEKLETRPRYQRFHDHVTTVQMDGQLLDKLGDSSVDIIGSNFGLSIFPDRNLAWRSAARVLRDGGVLFATVWDAQSANIRWVDGCAALARETQVAAIAQASGSESASAPPFVLPSTKVGHATIAHELRAAGFRGVEMFRTRHSVVSESPSELVRALLNNPGFSGFIEHAGRERLETLLFDAIARDGAFATEALVADDSNPSKQPSIDVLKASVRPFTVDYVAHVVVATK